MPGMTKPSPHHAAFTELMDASRLPVATSDAPEAAAIEIAKVLTAFDDKIDDEWRARLVDTGGALLRLAGEINQRSMAEA